MELIFELVFQLVFQFVGEVLVEVGFHGAAKVFRSRLGRYAVSAAAAFAFGVWWGDHLSDAGHRPRLFWGSLALAGFAAVGGLYRRSRPIVTDERLRSLVWPPVWPTWRWTGFVVLNLATAAGIGTGWTPPVAPG